MRATNERLTILSEAEQAALYELPDFDDDLRLEYLNLTVEEQAIMLSRSHLAAKIYCALQIGYFKAKHLFFRFTFTEVEEDLAFILQQYFQEQNDFSPRSPVTKHERYAQHHAIAAHFGYQSWSQRFETLLQNQIFQIIRRDISPAFIVMELLGFLREKKIIRPGYTTLQAIIGTALSTERKRLSILIGDTLTTADKSALQALLKDEGTLSGLAELKQDAKDFKARMMAAEREKLATLKPLYLLAKTLLPQSKLSQQNIQYYSSLVDYYTVYDLRKKIKPEQTCLYLLCYIWQRYRKLNDNLIDAFYCHLKRFETEIKEKAKEEHSRYALDKKEEWFVMRCLARYFVDENFSDEMHFGKIRQEAFATVIPKDELQEKVASSDVKLLREIDFQWAMIDKLFHRFKRHLRPIMMALDFTSTPKDSPWLATILWFKSVFAQQQTLNQQPLSACPEGTLPKRLQTYLLESDPEGKQKLQADRYEFWIYRQLKKRLKSGGIYLEDSAQHRSLQQELAEAKEKGALLQPLDIPALSKPIKQLLDDRFAELHEQWTTFNHSLSQGKLKHLRFDETTKTLHLQKTKEDREEELQHRFYEQLPLCDITDVLRFVNERCRYSSVFTHIQPRYAKVAVDENSLMAAIIAQGLNSGNLNMAEISDIPYDFLLDTYQSRIRLATLKKANDLISDDIARMPIFPFYSLDLVILYGGVDGQKYEVETPTLKARNSRKYFKKGKGVVAYTLLANHIPLQVELIGAHEHESYFAFDIWYNNTTHILPELITGDMHCINKANFAIMDWFGGALCPRFTRMQAQVKHLYCGNDPCQYQHGLIQPAGQIDRQLIEDEWPAIQSIIAALRLKEITQSTLIKKLCHYTTDNRTRKAIFEYDKLIRSIYTLKYFQNRKLQRDVHRSQNRIESYHQLRAAIATAYGRKQLTGKGERELEISNQCGRLIANAIIHYNSAILSKLREKYEAEGNQKGLAILKKISPVAWRHINFQGHFIFTEGGKAIDLDAIINNLVLK